MSLVKYINCKDDEHFTSVGGLPQILDHPWPSIHRVHQKLRQVPILLFVSSGCRVFFNFKITNKILYINGNRRFVLTISYQVSLGVRGGCWLHHRCCPDQGLIRQLGRQPDRHHHRDPAHLRRHLPQGMY